MPTPADDADVTRLIAQMSLDERLAMLDGDLPLYGGLVRLGAHDDYHKRPFSAGRLDRLAIPGIRFIDGPRGVVLEGGATAFPVSMARGATFDPGLEERIGEAIGKELRSHGGNLFGGVCVNLLRHPAWGRAQETYGEDPHHLGQMGSALVRGVSRHALACVKHFAANSMENARFNVNVTISPRVLHELYLPHFRACIDAGAACVMSAYNAVNGEWCGQNRALLTGVLRDRWGFDGFVMTDFVLGLRNARLALDAGQDLEMPFRFVFHNALKAHVLAGDVSEERIDRSVRRILTKLRAVPAGEYPKRLRACPEHRDLAREAAEKSIVLLKNDASVLPLEQGQSLAVIGHLAAVPNLGDRGSSDGRPEQVITPLAGLSEGGRNVRFSDGNDHREAAEVAAAADVALVVVGYTAEDEGESIAPPSLEGFFDLLPMPGPLGRWQRRFTATRRPPLLAMIKSFWSKATRLGARAVLRRTRAELRSGKASFGAGGDRQSLELRPQDVRLIRAVRRANPRVVVAIMAGSAVITGAWQDEVDGILMLWYPGMEGGRALANVLGGAVNPSGRLPFAIPKAASDLPLFDASATSVVYDLWHGYRKLDRDGVAPLYPFGFGLSYTSFRYAALSVESPEIAVEGRTRVSVEVTNTGLVAGDEVVQMYVGARASQVERPHKELKGFRRVGLAAGETKQVVFELAASDLQYFDEARDDFVVEATDYLVTVARNAAAADALTAVLRIHEQR